MRRRALLAGIGAFWTAGCTYAPGGGDVLGVRTFPSAGDGASGPLFARGPDRTYLTARSGRQWVDRETGFDYAIATAATVVTRTGNVVWRFQHGEASDAVALGDRLFLVTSDRVLASEPIVPGSGSVETGIAWTASRESERGPYAAVGDTFVRPSGDGIEAVRDGTVVWSRSIPGTLHDVRGAAGGIHVRTATEALRIERDGAVAWRRPADEVVTAPAEGATIVREAETVGRLAARSGDVEWTESIPGGRAILDVTASVIHVRTPDDIVVHDASTGRHRGTLSGSPERTACVVGMPERAVVARDGGRLQSVTSDGVAWERVLPIDATPLDGWHADDGVAFAFSNGEIYRLQPRDAGRPLFLSAT